MVCLIYFGGDLFEGFLSFYLNCKLPHPCSLCVAYKYVLTLNIYILSILDQIESERFQKIKEVTKEEDQIF